jgi:hypothetical protein
VSASVTANRPSFVQGEGATLFATVTNRGSNAPLRDLTFSFSVGGVFEAAASVGYVAMGGSASLSVSWPRIEAPPATYPVGLRVAESGLEIASASSSLEVAGDEAELQELAVESAAPAGAEVVARFGIENREFCLCRRIGRLALFDRGRVFRTSSRTSPSTSRPGLRSPARSASTPRASLWDATRSFCPWARRSLRQR